MKLLPHLLLILFTFVLPPTNAESYSTEYCDINLEATVRIDQSSIEFLDENEKSLYKILNDNVLIVNEEVIALNEAQQILVTQYSKSIKAIMPEVRSLVAESLSLAKDGLILAFDNLLGQNNSVSSNIVTELDQLNDNVLLKLSSEQVLIINNDGIKGESWTTEGFEQQVETVIEQTVEKSIGSMLVLLGQSMISSGGISSFEEKMEQFSEQIEQEIELRSAKIKQQGNQLCMSVVKIEQLENKLQISIKQLKEINIIELKRLSS